MPRGPHRGGAWFQRPDSMGSSERVGPKATVFCLFFLKKQGRLLYLRHGMVGTGRGGHTGPLHRPKVAAPLCGGGPWFSRGCPAGFVLDESGKAEEANSETFWGARTRRGGFFFGPAGTRPLKRGLFPRARPGGGDIQ